MTFLFHFSFYLQLLSVHSVVGDDYAFAPLSKFNNGYPEQKYEQVLTSLLDVYGPIVKERGGELKILKDWSDGAVNMWAFRWDKEYWLEIPGGMSRYYLINEEAFVVSICHELGHLLGGQPKSGNISFEGQSDYFATQECAELLLSEIKPYKDLAKDKEVDEYCENSLCSRVLKGAKSLTSYYAELEKKAAPQISTPSQIEVGSTLTRHPPAQCRLDTLVAGFSKEKRPSCWFAN